MNIQRRIHEKADQAKYFLSLSTKTSLESLYHQEPLSATSQLKELVVETVELVELHMPAIETSKVRQALDHQ